MRQYMISEHPVDSKYRNLLFKSSTRSPELIPSSTHCPKWQLDCPCCGARRAHLVWISRRSTYKFICPSTSWRNCGLQAEFPVLLKVWNPPLYLRYLKERESVGAAGTGPNCPPASEPAPQRRSKRGLNNGPRQVPRQVNPPSSGGSEGGP